MDENIDYSKIDFEKASKLLDKKLRDKAVLKEKDFKHAGEKDIGINQGYVAKDISEEITFMMKQGRKK